MDLSGRERKAAQEAIRSSEEVHFIAPEQTLGRTSMLYSTRKKEKARKWTFKAN
jgi:hypothetical protein